MKKLTVRFTAEFKATIWVSDEADEHEIENTVSNIDIPENEQCKYVADTFEPNMYTLDKNEEVS